jgi:hypothetical protein
VNVSLPGGVYSVLSESANILGTSVSQVTLLVIMGGLPALSDQVKAVQSLANPGK